jgi:hypothetical protein
MRTVEAAREEFAASERGASPDRVGTRLARPMMPSLFALVDRCTETLGLKTPVELFVNNDGSVSAWASAARDRRIQINFTSGILNQFDEAEMLYVLWYEITHALFGHLETPRLEDAEDATGITVLRSFALQRCEEITADASECSAAATYSLRCALSSRSIRVCLAAVCSAIRAPIISGARTRGRLGASR